MGSPMLNDALCECIKNCIPILFDDFHRTLVCEKDKLLAFRPGTFFVLKLETTLRFKVSNRERGEFMSNRM
jgi:hypothetical protein